MNHVNELQDYLMLLDEGYGTAYERYALNRFLGRLVRRLKVRSVLETPANGIMGVPGIKSLMFAKLGCDVTLINPSRQVIADIKRLWDALDLSADFIVSDYYGTDLPSGSFDLVWNFCVFEHLREHSTLVGEMARLSRRYVLVETQNIFNLGTPLHALYHKLRGEPWDHGFRSSMDYRVVKADMMEAGLKILEIDATDMPPWPDINMKLSDVGGKSVEAELEFRPSVRTKTVEDIVRLWRGTPLSSRAADFFSLWYLLEACAPRFVRLLYSHHPYVIGRK